MRTIDKIITKVITRYGAPMGRANKGELLPDGTIKADLCCPSCGWLNVKVIDASVHCPQCETDYDKQRPFAAKIYNCNVPLAQGYDKGGAYWGCGAPLRVKYTKDLSFIEFYRCE